MTLEHSLLSIALTPTRRRHRSLLTQGPELQKRVFSRLLDGATSTAFGRDHRITNVMSRCDYAHAVPLRTYSDYAPYWERIRAGERDVLLPGKPRYWARTGGTTGSEKLIPIYKNALRQSSHSFNLGLSVHVNQSPRASILGTKILFLGSCSALAPRDGLPTGFMSSILAAELSPIVKNMVVPGTRVDHIPAWSDKVERIYELIRGERLSIIAGMPPWLAAFFRYLVERTGKPVLETWPDLSLVLHSGVAMTSYRATIEQLLTGGSHPLPRFMNAFGTTEGNFAFQDDPSRDDMLLLSDEFYFEFVPMDDYLSKRDGMRRLGLDSVRVGEDYVLVLNTPGGLRSYVIGDTVRFTSVDPPRIVISGRTAQVLNHAGEKVSVDQVTRAIHAAADRSGATITEFSLCATNIATNGDVPGTFVPGHKWFVEFGTPPSDANQFRIALDEMLAENNPLYAVRRRSSFGEARLLAEPQVVALPKGSFHNWLSSNGRLGGHFKVPRISSEEQLSSLNP